MNFEDPWPVLSRLASQNSVQIEPHDAVWFCALWHLSKRWGDKINITTNLSEERFITENILDPLLALKAFQASEAWSSLGTNQPRILDVGCGGGFEGYVWHKLAGWAATTVLLDRERKKIAFCREVIRCLGMTEITAHNSRVEDLDTKVIPPFDLILARATWGATEFVRRCWRLLAPEGRMVYFAGGRTQVHPGFFVAAKIPYTLLPDGQKRCLVVVKNRN